MTAPLAWGARVSAEFRRLVVLLAREGGFDPSDLMAVIAFETGRTFAPDVRNALSGATGLLQFMPSTAQGLGTTTAALAAMSAEEQLRVYVRAYLRPYYGRVRTLSDLYMAVLWPKAVGQAETYKLFSEGSTAYLQNKGLDVDKDGAITKAEAAAYVVKARAEGLRPENATVADRVRDDANEEATMETKTPTLGIGGLLGMLHPAAGILFNVFAPALKQKLAERIDGQSGTPGAGQALADALSDALLSSARDQTGKTDELEAVAVARQNPVMVQAAQEAATVAVEERMKQLAPVLAQSVEFDKEKWQAEREGRDAATERSIKERQAGLWDMTRTLVYTTCLVLFMISVGLLVLIGRQSWQGVVIDSGLIGLAGPIWMGTIASAFMAMIMHRFDGTKDSAEQTKAMLRLLGREQQ